FVLRQHAGLSRAARALFHDGRQPRQLHRQPRAGPGRLRTVREHRRSRRDHLFLDRRGRACLGDLAVAVGPALESSVHHRAMSPRRKAAADPLPRVDPEVSPAAITKPAPAPKPGPEKPAAEVPATAKRPARKRRSATLARLEATIGYTFNDVSLAD